jgi:hypothetical protein
MTVCAFFDKKARGIRRNHGFGSSTLKEKRKEELKEKRKGKGNGKARCPFCLQIF